MPQAITTMSWAGSESSPAGSATFTVDGASMTLDLPDFKTANSVHFLLLRAVRAGAYRALQQARRSVHQELTRLEDQL